MSNIEEKYLYELQLKCNPTDKGFSYLLFDNSFYFNEYKEYISKHINSKNISKLIKEFGTKFIDDNKQKYFFTHLEMYFNNFRRHSFNTKRINIITAICTYVENPFDYIIKILHSKLNSSELKEYTIIFQSNEFYYLLNKQFETYRMTNNFNNIKIDNTIFSPENINVYHQLSKLFNRYKITSALEFKIILENVCDIFLHANTNDEKMDELENVNDKIDSEKKDKKVEISKEEKKSVNVAEKINEKILNNFLNSENEYVNKIYNKYKIIAEKMEADSPDCRIAKSILFLLSYFNRHGENEISKHVKKIINADIGWAVGSENNKKSSFYGDSDLYKYFYTYYSFMNNKENPYAEIINNKITVDMDMEAMALHKYFKEHGAITLDLANEKVNKIYNLLINIKDFIKIIDEPIDISSGAGNLIQGFINGIMNSAATMLDFSLSSIIKELFYADVIPINGKKFSVASIYNYLAFLKIILNSVDKNMDIQYIDKELFINKAYETLGVSNFTIQKIGYGAYSETLNKEVNFEQYYSFLYPNKSGINFVLRNDLKLLYSLIQFAVQKNAYLFGDNQYETKINFGNIQQINTLLNSLTSLEVYYIFKLYNRGYSNFYKDVKNFSEENIFDFNKNLLFIDNIYNHNSTDFYKLYLDEDKEALTKSFYNYNFDKTYYQELIYLMRNIYKKAIEYNKTQLETIFLQANDVSDIDDFLMRFLPSIIELMKTLNYEKTNIESVVKFIDKIMLFISEYLFKKLFINSKNFLQRELKRYTDKMFEPIKNKLNDFADGLNYEYSIDFNFGEPSVVQTLEKIIKMIESGNFNIFNIQNCFNSDSVSYSGYEPMEEDRLIFGQDGINKTDFINSPNNNMEDEYFSKDMIDSVIINDKKNDGTKQDGDINSNNDINIMNPQLKDNKKIFYKEGEIILEKNDGTKIIIVSKKDKLSESKIHINDKSVIEKILSQDQYKQLFEIKNYIDNITNLELINLTKEIKFTRQQLVEEQNKNRPNYNTIKNYNKKIENLTSLVNDVKTKNRILTTSNNQDDEVIIKDFHSKSDSKTNYSDLNTFFKKQKVILQEVNNIVLSNNVPLTNFQITKLLK